MASKKLPFRELMALWVAANGIPSDVLGGPRFKLPLENKDPVWVWDELLRDPKSRDDKGNRPWATNENKLDLMINARASSK